MPPRHEYWTIIVDDQPTAFRARDVEELLPTFNRLREKHPSAILKWFERGRLWESRHAARREAGGGGERREADRERRDRKWRPGGEHRDPRQKYKDAKKAKWDRFKQKVRGRSGPRRERDDRGEGAFTRGEPSSPHGDPMRRNIERDQQPREFRPEGTRAFRPNRDRKSWGGKPAGGGTTGAKRFGPKRFGKKRFGSKPFGAKRFGGKPPRGKPFGGNDRGPKKREDED